MSLEAAIKARAVGEIDAPRLLARYAYLASEAARIEADRTATVAQANASAAALAAPIAEEMQALYVQLRCWWELVRPDVEAQGRKSIEHGGCVVGERLTTPKLAFAGTEEQAVSLLESGQWTNLLNRTVKLDKGAIARGLRHDALAPVLKGLGFSIAQHDEFFVAVRDQ